jgi:hypothetical protein
LELKLLSQVPDEMPDDDHGEQYQATTPSRQAYDGNASLEHLADLVGDSRQHESIRLH